jgi:polyphenol oxidase
LLLPNVAWIIPTWPAPANVHALTTLRTSGSMGHGSEATLANRAELKQMAHLPAEPLWLQQVHGNTVVSIQERHNLYDIPEADASVAFQPNQVCAVLTADCVPILLCNQSGTRVSAIHAGWKGQVSGVIEAAVQKLDCDPSTLLAWLGPAIGPRAFEVQQDVLDAFSGYVNEKTFVPTSNGRWLGALYELARERLRRLHISQIFGGEYCTYTENTQFYSARRSDKGRMASLIWFTPP